MNKRAWVRFALGAGVLLACTTDTDDPAAEPGTGSESEQAGGGDAPGGFSTGSGERTDAELPQPVDNPAPPGTGSCQDRASGVFAFRADADAWWGREGGVAKPGRGVLEQFFIMTLSEPAQDLGFNALVQVCGTSIPAFEAGPICEAYQPNFETDWDAVPGLAIEGSWSCLEPGCDATLGDVITLIGMSLDDVQGAWPSASEVGDITCPEGARVDCFPDEDQDGFPGITARMTLDGVYKADDCLLGLDRVYNGAPPGPIDALLPGQPRASEVFLGIRVGMNGTLTVNDDCSGGEGVGQMLFLDTRAMDCQLDNGEPCEPNQAAYVDENLPIHHPLAVAEQPPADVGGVAIDDQSPGKGLTYRAIRLGDLGDSVSCAQALAAFD